MFITHLLKYAERQTIFRRGRSVFTNNVARNQLYNLLSAESPRQFITLRIARYQLTRRRLARINDVMRKSSGDSTRDTGK